MQDRVAHRLDKVIDVCAQLFQCLKDFEAIVLKENDAIGRSDLMELEAITEEKILYGDRTSKQIQALQEVMDLLAMDLGNIPRRTADDKQLTTFVRAANQKVKLLYPELTTKMNQFSTWSESLKTLRVKVFAQIETNAYLVQKLLDYHRETYAFWQAVAQESESGYGKSGKTKYGQGGPSKSLLTVRT
ncbi:MAG: hypothetical protein EOP10_21725 [Proteobacteria bacterium]|nr:MAG: hypothetical protein EOP10_21725 [Pseudomonadota bacterium]